MYLKENYNLLKLADPELLEGFECKVQSAIDILEKYALSRKEEALFTRPAGLAELLLQEINLTAEPILAVLLKEPFAAGFIQKEDLQREFGSAVLLLVEDLQKIDGLDKKKFESNTENFIKLLLTISEDIRVVLIRLGQCLYEVRNLKILPADLQRQVTGEAVHLYIPIAHRTGLYRIKTELEDKVMAFTQPEVYSQLARKIRESQEDRNRYTKEFIHPIETKLKETGFECEILSRVKSIPSIYRKMQIQKVEFEKVYDLFAIRIIINNTLENEASDCWRVYSLVTDIYTPNSLRLRDWISFPKPSGYSSLHTTVIGPGGKWVEVQIRTRRMDDIAEKSTAAHWKYKAGKKSSDSVAFFARIRESLEKPVAKAAEKTVTAEKKALYTDEIFIFTPKGDLKRLKAGYTVLDFAYEIHTDIGSRCTGAIVNGVMEPIRHVLKNGDTVKIITSKNQKPNSSWLDFVKSPRVTARIRHALKMENYKESEAGKEIIKNKVLSLGEEFTDPLVNKLVEFFDCESPLDLYQKFGEGKLDPLKIKKGLQTEKPVQTTEPAREETFAERISDVISGKEDFVVIDEKIRSIHYQFAHCCNPVPGDKIFAFVSVTQGIKVHKTVCPNAHELVTRYPYRILEARWKGAVLPENERSHGK
ncbi:MAG: RelA/SpoT family protein [Syntrophothermus sp.]